MAGEASPTDGRFRRGVYVMLIALGLIAASAGIWARDAADRSAHSDQVQRATATALQEALRQNAALLAGQTAAERRDDAAMQRDLRGAQEREALKQVLAQLLARSSDPAVSRAFRPYAPPSPAPSRADNPSARPSSKPTTEPSPPSSPRPSPSPSPTCIRLPLLGCRR